jgi:Ni/Co efflux regulator RcnB
MNKIICMLLLSLFFAAPTIVHAQDTSKVAKTKMERKKEMREKRKNLTPEQKEKAKEMVQKRKEKWRT